MTQGDVVGPYRLLCPVVDYGGGQIWLGRATDGGTAHVDMQANMQDHLRPQVAIASDLATARGIAHANVARVLAADAAGDREWFAVEPIDGLRLPTLLDGLRRGGRVVPPWTVAAVLVGATKALRAIQRARRPDGRCVRTLGRPLYPAHIGLTPDGEVKVGTFVRSDPERTNLGQPVSPYQSPESLDGGAIDGRSDLFSLGVISWELLADRPLFARLEAGPMRQAILDADVPPLPDTVPELMVAVTVGCLARRPDDRFDDVDALLSMLEDALRQRPESSAPQIRRVLAVASKLLPDRRTTR